MRLRFPELLVERGISAYQLAKLSRGRISYSTAARLKRERGRLRTFDARILEALCDVLRVSPGELFQRGRR